MQPRLERLLLGTLLEEAPVGFALLDGDLRYRIVNRALARMNGVSVEEHIGRAIREVVPAVAPQAERYFRQVLRTGEPIRNLEIVGLTTAGEGAWLESVYRVVDESGLACCAVIVVEVTEERRALAERDAFARLLMQGLMPPDPPPIAGASMATYYAPAMEGYAGGDFWDAFLVDEASALLALGDAAGRGPRAAALMSVVRHSIRSLGRFERRPSRLLAHLNAILLDAPLQEEEALLCSVAVARIHPSDSHLRITISLAGHPQPLVVRADGRVARTGRFGSLLGATKDVCHSDRIVDLRSGDALVMFTDGLVEQRGLDAEAEESRLRAILAAAGGADAQTMLSRIQSELLGTREHAEDDVAVLILRKD